MPTANADGIKLMLLPNGGNRLSRAPYQPGDEQNSGWSREQLVQMDADFVATMSARSRAG